MSPCGSQVTAGLGGHCADFDFDSESDGEPCQALSGGIACSDFYVLRTALAAVLRMDPKGPRVEAGRPVRRPLA